MRLVKAGLIAVLLFGAGGCAELEKIYRPADTVALQGPPAAPDTSCDAPDKAAPAYDIGYLKDCTAPDTFILFAFSGGGIRSASFGYGALTAAHAIQVPDAAGAHPLSQDIDVVSGVSGGSFTAAAFATHREALFPKPGAPDLYRANFLTHDFFADLASIYLAPWHWQWMLPDYSSQDEMAKIYGAIPFSSPNDPVFARTYDDLARQGRPLLVVQATDYGNEQPFTFTQNDFDLICSDLRPYPVGNAVAASSAFPVLFSPIRLTNHHFDGSKGYCAGHRPPWIDGVLAEDEPEDLSRLYTRARIANDYLPPKPGAAPRKGEPPRSVFLQDGGVVDNMALRGFTNAVLPYLGTKDGADMWKGPLREAACKGGWNKVRHVAVVVVDGQARPNNQVSQLPYLSDMLLILDVTSSALIDATGFETMMSTSALTNTMAERLSQLHCDGDDPARTVTPWFAHVSFDELAEDTVLPPAACDRSAKEGCTLGDLARSGTSLAFKGEQVDALVAAGESAFRCNPKIKALLGALHANAPSGPPLPCRPRKDGK
jgi:NTE family protein